MSDEKRAPRSLDACPACREYVDQVDQVAGGPHIARPCGHPVVVTIYGDHVELASPPAFVTGELEDPEAGQPAIPGLDAAPRGASELDKATRRTIVALTAVGLVGEREAMVCQLMLDLAVVVDAGRRQGKAAAAAMAATQLLAAYQLLVPDAVEGGGDDAFDELARDLRAAGARALAEFQGSGATVRDPETS